VVSGSDPAGAWFIVVGALLAVATSFGLRTRLPAPAVAALLALAGAAIGWGGMMLQPDPPMSHAVLTVVALAVLVPFHVRVVIGPFGRRRAEGNGGDTGR
jgi:hypothetical protein